MRIIQKKKQIETLFIVPCLAGMIVFYIFPCGVLFVNIFEKNGLLGGYIEYKELLTSGAFVLAINNMCKFVGIMIPFLLIISFSVAVSMQYLDSIKYKLMDVIFMLHLVPMIIPSAVIAVALKSILSNYLYSELSVVILALIFIWKNYGYIAVVLYGGMQTIAAEVIESARIEGAGNVQLVWKIILPQMKGFISYSVCLGIIGVFKCFKESYLLFGKYPFDSVYMYQNFINNNLYAMNYGRLAVTSLLLIIFFVIFIYFVLLRRNEAE